MAAPTTGMGRLGVRGWHLLVLLLALVAAGCAGGDAAEDGSPPEGSPSDSGAAGRELGLLEPGRLVVGSDLAFAPFEFIEDGQNRGFDVDLINAIAEGLRLEVEIVNTSFDTIFTQLGGGQFDAVISAVTITDERDQTIDFSQPYFQANQALAVPQGSDIPGVADLGGRAIGVQAGTTGLEYANATFAETTIVEFPTSEAAFGALAAGQIEAVFIDIPVVQERVDSGDDVAIAEEIDTDELYGIGVQEGNSALQEAINAELQELIDDGTYAEIFSTWFPDAQVPEEFAPTG